MSDHIHAGHGPDNKLDCEGCEDEYWDGQDHPWTVRNQIPAPPRAPRWQDPRLVAATSAVGTATLCVVLLRTSPRSVELLAGASQVGKALASRRGR